MEGAADGPGDDAAEDDDSAGSRAIRCCFRATIVSKSALIGVAATSFFSPSFRNAVEVSVVHVPILTRLLAGSLLGISTDFCDAVGWMNEPLAFCCSSGLGCSTRSVPELLPPIKDSFICILSVISEVLKAFL